MLTAEEQTLIKQALEEYKKWVIMEETSWRQKSRELWLREGDKNTGYFHKMVNAHKRVNSLVKIKINGRGYQKNVTLRMVWFRLSTLCCRKQMSGGPGAVGCRLGFWKRKLQLC